VATLSTKYSLRTPVHIDGCEDLTGYITSVQWRHAELVMYEVSWMTNGKSENSLIEEWRITEAVR
jgi:hypothetical protein